MARIYTDIVDLIEQKLQDTSNAEFAAAEINYEMEDSLKEFGTYPKHENLVPVIYKIESRFGQCTTTSASNLTDTSKLQFVSADDSNEKVVHNTTDDTWAVIASRASTSVIGLSADIFVSGEQYEIYNKRCFNKRQIFIGDMIDYLRVARVEYPVGRPRDYTIYGKDILEIDAARIGDSNSTLSTLDNVDVLVWFAKPHLISQTVDLAGTASGAASAGATTFAVGSLGSTVTIEEGSLFTIVNHRTTYTTTADATTSGNAATFSIVPALEAAVGDNDAVTFISSTLLPDDEDIFTDLVVARLLVNKAPKFIRTIAIGGQDTSSKYINAGERKLAQIRAKLSRVGARTTYHYSRY